MVAEKDFSLENGALNSSLPAGLENANSKDILDYLFANNNKLMTASAAELALPKDTQGLIAYFSGGERYGAPACSYF